MITHVVLLRVHADVPQTKVDAVFAALRALKGRIPGLKSFAGGPYSSPEGLDKGYTHGFVMTFEDAAARDAYLRHPEHEQVKALMLEILDGGLEGVVAFDFAS